MEENSGEIKAWREGCTKMDLKVMGVESVNWIHMAQDRIQWQALPNTVMNLRVP
jgi:hypothetical protein